MIATFILISIIITVTFINRNRKKKKKKKTEKVDACENKKGNKSGQMILCCIAHYLRKTLKLKGDNENNQSFGDTYFVWSLFDLVCKFKYLIFVIKVNRSKMESI